jgi:hypothetical protein
VSWANIVQTLAGCQIFAHVTPRLFYKGTETSNRDMSKVFTNFAHVTLLCSCHTPGCPVPRAKKCAKSKVLCKSGFAHVTPSVTWAKQVWHGNFAHVTLLCSCHTPVDHHPWHEQSLLHVTPMSDIGCHEQTPPSQPVSLHQPASQPASLCQ